MNQGIRVEAEISSTEKLLIIKKNYLAVNMSDTVEIPRNCKRFVRMVPQNFTLNENRD